jgi:23S rRNA pseudouridine955/2504/2580 synthase
MPISLTAAADDDGRRLDRILRKALPEIPLSAIHRLLRKGGVLVDGEKAAIDYRVKAGQTITVTGNLFPNSISQRRRDAECRAQFANPAYTSNQRFVAPLRLGERKIQNNDITDIILFEGAGLLVLNKPAGLPVHGRESLEGIVRSYLVPKLSPSLSFKPGPLHRLDRPSSGVIAFSTSLEGARFFSAMMRNRMIKKQYLALVNGVIEKDEVWEDELVRDERQKKTFRGGIVPGVLRPGEAKTALTRVSPLAGDGGHTLVLAEIETGRTHQIRAQAAGRGHPLLGDRKYGDTIYGDVNGDNIRGGFLLHAWRMEFTVKTDEKTDNDLYGGIPRGLPGGLPPCIEAPLPENFLDKIRNFFGGGIINKRLSHL